MFSIIKKGEKEPCLSIDFSEGKTVFKVIDDEHFKFYKFEPFDKSFNSSLKKDISNVDLNNRSFRIMAEHHIVSNEEKFHIIISRNTGSRQAIYHGSFLAKDIDLYLLKKLIKPEEFISKIHSTFIMYNKD